MFLHNFVNDNATHFSWVIIFNLQHACENVLCIYEAQMSHFAHAGYGAILINRRLIHNVKCVTIRTPGITHLWQIHFRIDDRRYKMVKIKLSRTILMYCGQVYQNQDQYVMSILSSWKHICLRVVPEVPHIVKQHSSWICYRWWFQGISFH